MAGLESLFQSRAQQIGATANAVGGGQVPEGMHTSPLPAVSKTCSNETKKLYADSFLAQVSPTRQPLGWATLLPSLGRTPTTKVATGKSGLSTNLASGNAGHPPKPNASLVARLSLASAKAVLTSEKKTNTKSVEAMRNKYRSRFSGYPSAEARRHVGDGVY